MNTQSDVDKGPSLPQLVSALNEELKRAAYSPSFTLHEVSQLDKDATTALMAIREWKNSFTPINRLPLDILSLIPSHLTSQDDRFRASFVCRHWRRTFLQRAELWSELFLSKSEAYVKALLGRVKGSALEVVIDRIPVLPSAVALLSTFTRQIRDLYFVGADWEGVQTFSEITLGPFPFLRTFTFDFFDSVRNSVPFSQPLLDGAVNLEELRFRSESKWPPTLIHFAFPNLVSLNFSVTSLERFCTPPLLDFLEASPKLRTVHIGISAQISLEGVSRGRIVTLPNVETFTFLTSTGGSGYKVAAHISCPSVKFMSLIIEEDREAIASRVRFPAESWNAIVCQYTKSPVEEIVVEARTSGRTVTCKLTFRSADATVIELCFKSVDIHYNAPLGFLLSPEEMKEIIAQATRTVVNHPQLANAKRLRLRHDLDPVVSPSIPDIANEVRQLFRSVGLLDELIIYRCELSPYLHSFITSREDSSVEPLVYPPTKVLTISHPVNVSSAECTAIEELAKSQHALGIPFERVIICEDGDWSGMEGMEERLRPWVGSVDYRYDGLDDDDWGFW